MLQTSYALFLTLVLLVSSGGVRCFASPVNEAPPDKIESVDETPVDPAVLERVSITPVPPTTASDEYSRQFSKADYFYNHRKAITLRGGMVFGFEDSSDSTKLINGLLGVSYLCPTNLLPWKSGTKAELGADLSFVGQGHLTFMQRKIYNDKSSFRPYYRYGVMLIADPEDKLAFVSDWERYLARAGVGFEDTQRPSKSLRVELELAAGMKDVLALFTVGYVWGI